MVEKCILSSLTALGDMLHGSSLQKIAKNHARGNAAVGVPTDEHPSLSMALSTTSRLWQTVARPALPDAIALKKFLSAGPNHFVR